jgi:ribose-phosphate pyrophosphokinase
VSTLIFSQAENTPAAPFLASAALGQRIAAQLKGELADYTVHDFPDGETYIRVTSACQDKRIIILADLHQPNAKLLPLLFLCELVKEMGAASVILVCPYLPYMRQDIQFQSGEAVTSRFFARLLSQYIDHLITIDPHLHRYHCLSQIYRCETSVLQAHPLIVEWIKTHIENPLIIGPDSESEQWAANAATLVGCPYLILEKQRFGDTDVSVSANSAQQYSGRTPVLIDDIISTGRTMIKTAQWLTDQGFCSPVCIGVHALFSGDALSAMQAANIKRIITVNTIEHASNAIDMTGLLSETLAPLCHPA